MNNINESFGNKYEMMWNHISDEFDSEYLGKLTDEQMKDNGEIMQAIDGYMKYLKQNNATWSRGELTRGIMAALNSHNIDPGLADDYQLDMAGHSGHGPAHSDHEEMNEVSQQKFYVADLDRNHGIFFAGDDFNTDPVDPVTKDVDGQWEHITGPDGGEEGYRSNWETNFSVFPNKELALKWAMKYLKGKINPVTQKPFRYQILTGPQWEKEMSRRQSAIGTSRDSEYTNENTITKKEILQYINESLNELGATFAQNVPEVKEKSPVEESAPPGFPKALVDRLINQYGEGPKAYATMWKMHNAKRDGNKQVTEMWAAWENKSKQECAPCGCDDPTDDHLGESNEKAHSSLKWKDGVEVGLDSAGKPIGYKSLGYANSPSFKLPEAKDWRRFKETARGYEAYLSPSLKAWYEVDSSG